jgi:lipopolysaccharide transport system ATP-binding protein
MPEPIISIRDMGKRYRLGLTHERLLANRLLHGIAGLFRPSRNGGQDKDFWALRDVCMDVAEGEVLGLVGRNGAGKSTLLKILSRITEPTTGEIRLRGRVASLLEVGTGFHPELTGRENIYLNGAILGMSTQEIRSKFDEIVAFSEIETFLDTPVKRYSSGMYIRLAFAVAAHLEPEILLVDEVLAVGDSAFQTKCLGKMSEVSRAGRTVVFVSHNMASIRQLCSSAALLTEGTLACKGDVQDVVREYLRSYQSTAEHGAFIARNEDLGITLRKMDLLDADQQPVTAMQAGSPITFRLALESTRAHKNLFASISVNTPDDLRVCVLHTRIAGFQHDLTPPGADLLCHLPRVNFLPGLYRLHVKIAVGHDCVAFYQRHATEFAVEGGDFYGTGRLPDPAWGGICLVDNSWRYAQSSQP